MKLLQINITANSGSTGRIVEEIGRLAISVGWESYIAYGRAVGESGSKLFHIGNMWDERWHGVQTRLFDRHGLASKKATKGLIAEIDKIHPDIIQLHNIHGYYLNYPILFNYLAKSNIPVVWTLHDCWAFTGHCASFDGIGCVKWKTHCENCPQKRVYPSSFLIDNSKSNFTLKQHYFNMVRNMTIVVVSNWLNAIVEQSFLSKYPINVIFSGIDLNAFNNKGVHRVGSMTPIILGVASVWNDKKGLSDFVKLSEHEDIQIVLIGVSEEQKRALPYRIKAVCRTNNKKELANFYSSATVFVNPTYEDTFGLVNVEAMACGTPVVTYNTGGSPESLTKETGIVVPKGDVEGLYSAIKSIIGKSPVEKEEQRRLCVERAKEFDAKVRYQEYIHLYEKLLSL